MRKEITGNSWLFDFTGASLKADQWSLGSGCISPGSDLFISLKVRYSAPAGNFSLLQGAFTIVALEAKEDCEPIEAMKHNFGMGSYYS